MYIFFPFKSNVSFILTIKKNAQGRGELKLHNTYKEKLIAFQKIYFDPKSL